jgi:hypothetical protein
VRWTASYTASTAAPSTDAHRIPDDGGAYVVDGALGDLRISGSTSVDIVAGGAATAPTGPYGLDAVSLSAGSVLTVNGGSVSGGTTTSRAGSGGDGVRTSGGDTLRVLDGSLIGGGKAASGGGFGGDALNQRGGSLTISGGTLSGTLRDGTALDVRYTLRDGATINLNPIPPGASAVPAAGTLVLLLPALALLTGGYCRRWCTVR